MRLKKLIFYAITLLLILSPSYSICSQITFNEQVDIFRNSSLNCSSSCFCLCGCKNCTCNDKVVQITKLPFTIKNSGAYSLNCDLSLQSCQSVTAGITVNANDVVINLNGFKISGSQYAIQVNSNLENVLIKNGSICNTTGAGIIVLDGVTNIQLENLKLFNCNQCDGTAAILFQGLAKNRIEGGNIEVVRISDCKNAGIVLQYSDFIKITHSDIQSIISTDTIALTSGIRDISGNNNLFQDCSVEHIMSLNSNGIARGFDMQGSISATFNNCSASNILAIAQAIQAIGFFIFGGTLQNCVEVDRCICRNISSSGASHVAYGFLTDTAIATLIKNCSACGVNAPGGGHGFTLFNSSKCAIFQCISQNNSGVGFFVTNNSFLNVLGHNKALGNGQFGFNNQVLFTNYFYSNFAALNPTANTNYSGITPVSNFGSAPCTSILPFCPTPTTFGAGANINGN